MFSPHPLPPLPLLYIFQSLLQVLFGIIFPLLAHSRLLFSKVIAPAMYILDWGFPGGSNSKKSTCNAGDPGSVLGSRRSPGEGNGNPLQYSCLEKPMDRGAWRATVHRVTKSRTRLKWPTTHAPYTRAYPGPSYQPGYHPFCPLPDWWARLKC